MLGTIGLLLATHRSVPPYVIARRHQLTHDRICSASDNKISVWLPHDGGLRPLRTAMCRGAKPELRWPSGRSGSAGEVRPSRARQKKLQRTAPNYRQVGMDPVGLTQQALSVRFPRSSGTPLLPAPARRLAQLASLDIALTRLPREHLSPPRKSRLGDLPGAMSRIAAKRLAAEAHYKGRLAFATTEAGSLRRLAQAGSRTEA